MKSWIALLWMSVGAYAAKPNIVFILADDLGYGDLSCYGQKNFQTPAIDVLAKGGLRFTDHYSGATVCAPSRTSLMTGKDGGHAAIRGNGAFNLPESETSVATLLKRAGYHTALIGKSCATGNTQEPEVLARHGFDLFYGTTDHKDGHFRYPKFVYENSERVEFPGNDLHTGTHYDVDFYTKRTLEYLDERSAEQPFFLILSLPVPHAAINLPGEKPVPSKQRYTKVADPKASYIGLMKKVDETVGVVAARLKEKGMWENTLVIFTSDNGPHSEGGFHPDMVQSSGPLRGRKRDLYEGGIRVPFIAHWPGVIQAGRESAHPSAFWDFLPTVCEMLSLPVPADIQGISYLPTLRGEGVQRAHDSLYWELHEIGVRRGLRAGDWKIVQYDMEKKTPGAFELYHLKDDLSEKTDLAKKNPEKLAEMRAKLDAARVPSPLFPQPVLDQR
jgi:arylsulfatase A-like enzyme